MGMQSIGIFYMQNESKFRLLSILSVLTEESDEDHPLTTQQIINKLNKDYNIPAHRTTVGNDIDILMKFGYDICKVESTSNKYFMASRQLEMPEIKIILDAVTAAKFITEKKSKELTDKILTNLCSSCSREQLKRNLIVEGRVKTANHKLFYVVDSINQAINKGCKIAFKYCRYDDNKELAYKNNGRPYVFSPYSLVWSGDFYYVVGYSDKHSRLVSFRVDRFAEVPELLYNEEAVPAPEDFRLEEMIRSSFSMYNSAKSDVILQCTRDVMDAVLEKFGMDIDMVPYGADKFRFKVNVSVSHIFFSWVFGFGGKVEILGPADVKAKYKEMVLNAARVFDENICGGGYRSNK